MAQAYAVTDRQVRWYRLAVHYLDHLYPASCLEAVAGVCGLQNSPPGAWETAAFARLADCPLSRLQAALEQEKTLLQAWSYRGASVVFPAAESPVFLSALAARPREEPWIYTRGITLALEYLGISWEQALDLVRRAAACLDTRTVQSKEELDRVLAAEAAPLLPPSLREKWNAPSLYGRPDRQTVGGAVVSFALRPCAFLGQVVFGARQGISPTFTSYTRWLGQPLPPDPEAEPKLVRKFLHAYGPATSADLGAWLGSSPRQTKRLWQTVAGELVPVEKAGKRAYLLEQDLPALMEPQPPQTSLVLVGPHDPYLDARDRSLLLENTTLQRQVWRTVANPAVILRDGQVAGIWKPCIRGKQLEITLEPFGPLSAAERQQLAHRAEAYAAFRGLHLRSLICTEP